MINRLRNRLLIVLALFLLLITSASAASQKTHPSRAAVGGEITPPVAALSQKLPKELYQEIVNDIKASGRFTKVSPAIEIKEQDGMDARGPGNVVGRLPRSAAHH